MHRIADKCSNFSSCPIGVYIKVERYTGIDEGESLLVNIKADYGLLNVVDKKLREAAYSVDHFLL